jgi:hypothetical protein
MKESLITFTRNAVDGSYQLTTQLNGVIPPLFNQTSGHFVPKIKPKHKKLSKLKLNN